MGFCRECYEASDSDSSVNDVFGSNQQSHAEGKI